MTIEMHKDIKKLKEDVLAMGNLALLIRGVNKQGYTISQYYREKKT